MVVIPNDQMMVSKNIVLFLLLGTKNKQKKLLVKKHVSVLIVNFLLKTFKFVLQSLNLFFGLTLGIVIKV